MKLENFLGKTLKAAKQSAQQIYGDDYSQLKGIMPENGEEKNKHFAQQQESFENADDERQSRAPQEPVKHTAHGGVVFERSESASKQPNSNKSNDINGKLDLIRKYAAEQSEKQNSAHNSASNKQSKSGKTDKFKIPKPVSELYSRKDIRPRISEADKRESEGKRMQQSGDTDRKNPSKNNGADSEQLYDQLINDLPNGVSRAGEKDPQPEASQAEDRDTEDLHKRLEQLESLVEGKLSSSKEERSTHPIYHKLVQKGVPKKLIHSWFNEIKQQGINIDKQQELFRSKLQYLISQKLQVSQAGPTAKMLIFTGRSGSGKSSMILKLATSAGFLTPENTAVVSFVPGAGASKQNYSIIQPFCRDKNIDFYKVADSKEVAGYQATWKAYEHVLFDTPALESGGQSLTSSISDLIAKLHSQATVETHYLINTSVQGTTYNDPLAKDIAADHVTLTHLDESTKWGKAIPFLFNNHYKLRYISSGPSFSGDLLPFDAKKFTEKLLRT